MTIARKHIIHPSISRYYHCFSRCVRRSFLCGEDPLTGQNFDHRKQWLVERLKFLASIFAVQIPAYAVLSSHYHIVLYWDIEQAERWSDREVVRRWCQLYRNRLGLAYLNNEPLLPAEHALLRESILRWRKRLMDISWCMRCLNEYIARKANREDECTGHFWEARFRSQALLDDVALLSCMVYVDLNPIRAGLCDFLEEADFTAIQERIRTYRANQSQQPVPTPTGLMAFSDERKNNVELNRRSPSIPYQLEDYLNLVDWTGRSVRDDKRGSIPEQAPPLLQRIGIQKKHWFQFIKRFGTCNKLKISGASEFAI
jgi:hypothetical protein